MGDIADATINGDFDFETGEYLGRGNGFPRTRKNIVQKRKRGERFRRTKFSLANKMNGVVLYLQDKGILDVKDQHAIIKYYGNQVLKLDLGKKKGRIVRFCKHIQSDFKKFVDWYKDIQDKAKIK